jgi:DNA mismatch endonuclease Vsr
MRTDTLTAEQRRRTMQAIKSMDTSLELILRRALWQKGLRYRKNYKTAIGKPDIVFVSAKVAVFCDSEFWHGYDWERRKEDFKANRTYWWSKIEKNIKRDTFVTKSLRREGWLVLRFWERDIKKHLNRCVSRIERCVIMRRRKLD